VTAEAQVAANAAVLRGLADVLTRWGLADEHDRAAWIANYLHREGWRHIEPLPALHGPSSTEAGRAEARRIYEAARRQGNPITEKEKP
jgi:hypothetical protein